MSQFLEVEGKTIDEAIFAGLEKMNLSFDEVDIEIIDSGNKGFLGIGSRLAKVRLTKRTEEQMAEQQAVLAEEKPQERNQDRPARKPQRPAPKQNQARQNQQRQSQPREKQQPIAFKMPEGEPIAADDPAITFLQNVLKHMNIKGDIEGVKTEDAVYLNIKGSNTGQLIGHRGETLDALQYLTTFVINKDREEYTRIILDTANYRAKREQTLVRLAQNLANKAVRTGHKINLEPMNPYERRIIHSALQQNRRVSTNSEGEGIHRRIVITPKK